MRTERVRMLQESWLSTYMKHVIHVFIISAISLLCRWQTESLACGSITDTTKQKQSWRHTGLLFVFVYLKNLKVSCQGLSSIMCSVLQKTTFHVAYFEMQKPKTESEKAIACLNYLENKLRVSNQEFLLSWEAWRRNNPLYAGLACLRIGTCQLSQLQDCGQSLFVFNNNRRTYRGESNHSEPSPSWIKLHKFVRIDFYAVNEYAARNSKQRSSACGRLMIGKKI